MRTIGLLTVIVLLTGCEPRWVKSDRLYGFGGVWENQNKLFVFSYVRKGNGNVPKYSLFSDSILYNTCYNFPGYKYDSPVVDIQCDNGDLYKVKRDGEEKIRLKGPFVTPQEETDLNWETYTVSITKRVEDWVKD